MAH
ncbi:hypothetical protein ECEC1862_2850, partial [Escherichia coli EC1862]|jgi:hypothetical protein